MNRILGKCLVAGALFFLVSGSDAFAQSFPPADLTPVVPTGIKRQLAFLATLNANCTSTGAIEARLVKKPVHGEVEIEQGVGYPNYRASDQRFPCNKMLVQGVRLNYTSADNFVGKDRFNVELFAQGGANIELKYTVTVK